MRLKIPLTGTVLEYHPELDGITPSGGISGDPSDPVRPVPVNLGNVSWRLVSIDLENDLAEIEVTPASEVAEPDLDGNGVQKVDGRGRPQFKTRRTTNDEKAASLEEARQMVEGHTREELYAMSGSPKLKNPFKK